MIIKAWCDGACAPTNPGGTGGWGYVIRDGNNLELSDYGIIRPFPELSNNFAEYCAVGACIKRWMEEGRKETLHIHTDSKLVVEQMNGRWKVREGAYVRVHQRLIELRKQVPFIVTFTWIPRDKNEEADRLSKKGLIEAGIIT